MKTLDVGWDAVDLREQYNAAAVEKQTAEEALASLPPQVTISGAQLEAWIDELGDVGEALEAASPPPKAAERQPPRSGVRSWRSTVWRRVSEEGHAP